MLWAKWTAIEQENFVHHVTVEEWTLQLEVNDACHEHVFPIKTNFLEFVAILDRDGLPVTTERAYAFFDDFKLPRVTCETGLPVSSLPQRIALERAATNREGAVLYLEGDDGSAVALVKVKTDFYVRARRTRQIFWTTVVISCLTGQDPNGMLPRSAFVTE